MKLLHLNQLTGRAQFFVGRGSDKPRVLISETGLVTVACRTSSKPKVTVNESGFIKVRSKMFSSAETLETVFTESFDSSDFMDSWEHEGNETVQRVTSPVRGGTHALQVDLDRSDSVPDRTEIALWDGDELYRLEYGEEHEFGFSLYFPASWTTDTLPEIVAQWHGSPDIALGEDWRSPPLALEIKDGNFRVVVRWDERQVQPGQETIPDSDRYRETLTEIVAPVETEVWSDWRFRIRWSYNSDGLVEVRKDDEIVFHRYGPNCFNDEKTPYFKMGIYKWLWKTGSSSTSTGGITTRRLFIDKFFVNRNVKVPQLVANSTFAYWTEGSPDNFDVIGTETETNYVAQDANGIELVSDGGLIGIITTEEFDHTKAYLFGASIYSVSGEFELGFFSSGGASDESTTLEVTDTGTHVTTASSLVEGKAFFGIKRKFGGSGNAVVSRIFVYEQ
jgi:hypothetical protein